MGWEKGVIARDKSYDQYIEDVIRDGAWGIESEYVGLETQEAAEIVRQKMRTAGNHMNPPVAVKAFWRECKGCKVGGPDCRFHVSFTVYDKDKARAYRARMDKQTGRVGNRFQTPARTN